ncbi:MAG: glucose-6-phosphate isomerase, partial [Rhodospirillales bacterium]
CDFIAPVESRHPTGDHHQRLLANFLAQAEALMRGRAEAEAGAALDAAGVAGEEKVRLLPHRVFAGNRPSNAILMDRVDPFTLGQLIALYEHKVFVQGVLWGINPFDQFGVELGKELAAAILPALSGGDAGDGHDSSTAGLIARLRAPKEGKP